MLNKLPRWDHIITKTNYNSQMAKRVLLGHPLRAAFGDMVTRVAMLKECIEKYTADLHNDDDDAPDAEDRIATAIATTEAALQSATTTVTIIASINAIEEFNNTERGRKMATHILAKSAGSLPDALRRKLQHLATV